MSTPITSHFSTPPTELSAANASLSIDKLKQKFKDLQEQSELLSKKLAGHRSGAGPKISSKDVTDAETKLKKYLDAWEKRRRTFNSIWADMSENIDRKQKDVFDDIGVETDEAVGEVASTYRKLITSSSSLAGGVNVNTNKNNSKKARKS